MVKGSKRFIWDSNSIEEFFSKSKKVKFSDERELQLDLAINAVGDYTIDHTMTCRANSYSSPKVLVVCNKDGHRSYRAVYDILKSKYECYHCVVDTLTSKAESKGYTLIDYCPDYKYSIIKCNKCGIAKDCLKSAILGRNEIDCEQCRVELYTKMCSIKGQNYLSHYRVKSGIKVVSECSICRTSSERYSSTVLSKDRHTIPCDNCLRVKYQECTVGSGFYFVEFAGETSCYIACSKHHTKMKVYRRTVLGGVKQKYCLECKRENIISKLKTRDCELVSFTTNSVTYAGSDGTIFTRPTGWIYGRVFPSVNDNSRNQPYKLYMMVLEYLSNTFIKIGIAVDPEVRLSNLKINLPVNIFEIGAYDSFSSAAKIEQKLFKEFKRYRLHVSIPESFCANSRKGSVDGATEWFDGEILSANFYEVLNELHSHTRGYSKG